ncbi:MAG: hypothetical protein IKQ88_02600 [Lachnospiraceae bacterium]|nr:hypothetical protein [Lachnospiraceae bacterium]
MPMIINSGTVSMGARRSYTQKASSGKLFEIRGKGFSSSFWGRSFEMSIDSALKNFDEENAMEEIRRSSLLYLLRNLHRIFFGRGYEANNGSYDASGTRASGASPIATYTEYASYEEHESTDFKTSGTVVTADGREISFGLSLSMSRSFKQEYVKMTDVYADNALNVLDPLVINLKGNIASVSDVKVSFDLDADGEKDEISVLNADSGYLSLDLNGDGIINDGSELFGTKSGDGFKDLSVYDSDGNGWIDEADPVFEKLKITVMDAEGNQTLYSLKDKGVGALCLQREDTDFSLKSLNDNHTNGLIRKTGFFLYEDGLAGTMQHLDLVR